MLHFSFANQSYWSKIILKRKLQNTAQCLHCLETVFCEDISVYTYSLQGMDLCLFLVLHLYMSNKMESEITNMLSNVCFQRTDIQSVELLSNISSGLEKNSHSMLLKHGSSCICTKPPSCYRGGREFNFPNNTEKLLEANYKSDQEKLQTANNSQVSFDIKIII